MVLTLDAIALKRGEGNIGRGLMKKITYKDFVVAAAIFRC